MRIIHVTTLDDAGLQPYRTLRRPVDHERKGIFVAEGEKVVRRLLESQLHVQSVLITPEWFQQYQGVLESHTSDIAVFIAPKPLLESIVGFHLHQGIMAVAVVPQTLALSELLARTSHPWLLVAVDGLTNAENLGVLVRNCAAFGVDAIVVGETSSSPYLRRAVRNSMGTVFNLSVVRVPDLVLALQELRGLRRIQVLAAHPHADDTWLPAAALKQDCCIVFGSEGEGISGPVLAVCDEQFAIPMREGVDSLNVASASAVVLYEVLRQREAWSGDSPGRGR